VENLRDESLIAQRVICDHLHNVGGLQKVELDKKLLLSASAARRKYQDYLDEQKRNKQLASVSDRKRKIEEELSDLKSRQKRLKTDIDSAKNGGRVFIESRKRERFVIC